MSTTATEVARPVGLKWPIFAVCIAILLGAYLAMPAYTEAGAADGYMLRVTARLAFFFLMLAYVARPLVQLMGVGRVLVRNRRYLGLAMALTHTVHFYYVVRVLLASGEPLAWETIVFGGLAFVLTWAMALTSNDASMRLLKRNWQRLHRFGLHYVWLIFMQTFAGSLAGGADVALYGAIVLLGLAGLLLRVVAYWRKRLTQRPAATP